MPVTPPILMLSLGGRFNGGYTGASTPRKLITDAPLHTLSDHRCYVKVKEEFQHHMDWYRFSEPSPRDE